jgi:hypothetical protein
MAADGSHAVGPLQPLSALVELTRLDLCCGFLAPDYSSIPVQLFAVLPEVLQGLDLRNTHLGRGPDGVLEPFSRLARLTQLDLSGCGLRSIRSLSAPTGLADLSLSETLTLKGRTEHPGSLAESNGAPQA